MSTAAAPPTEPVTPARIHRLANTAQVAGWGPGGVMPDWLDDTAAALIEVAHGLLAMSARARLDSADTVDELLGVTR